jgi:hypothetical protein
VGHVETIKLFLKKGADITIKDSTDKTPLEYLDSKFDLAEVNGHGNAMSLR